MATSWFDGVNLRINIPAGLDQEIDVQIDLYSDWKDWIQLGNSQYPPAFDTTGGDPTRGVQKVSPYFFLRNDLGWRLAPHASSNSTVIYVGNLYPRDATLAVVDFTGVTGSHLWETEISPQSLTLSTGSSTPPQVIRDAMELDATSGALNIDAKLNNNLAVSAAAL